jgi:LysR family transcriptional regulator, hydrogen peroxide-inducible genes activator
MKDVTLRQLRYFDALARHGHFGHAAAASAISQPALSVQIRELEATLGTQLFERGARQVRLTGPGQALLARVREILSAADDLHDLARAASGQGLGRLRLGVIPTIAPYLLPTLLPLLSRQAPGVDLHLRETLTPRLLQELADGRIDAAIVALPVSEPAFVEMPLFEEEFMLVRPAADAGLPVPDGEGLARMRLLLLEEGHCFRDQALSFCNRPTPVPQGGLEGSSLTTLVQMVGAGLGVTLIPDMAVTVEGRSDLVDIARFAAPRPTRTIGMIRRKTTPLADALTAIAGLVRSAGTVVRTRRT